MDLSRAELMELKDIVERLTVIKESLHPASQMNFDCAIADLYMYLPEDDK